MIELDEAAVRARAEAATELWTWREATDDTIAGWGAHMGQLLYRLPADGQTRDMRESILAMVADLPAALGEITRLRAALDEALSDHLCACGYGVVCGQCQRVDRDRAEAAEEERDEARAEVAKWESVAEDTLGANKVLLKAMRRADREREAAESALAAVRALHRSDGSGGMGPFCVECARVDVDGDQRWPCVTIRTIDAALGKAKR